MLEKIVLRIQELSQAIEQSAAQHNALIGAMQEARSMYEQLVQPKPEESLAACDACDELE
jgi:hypothetical protein